MGAVMLPIWAIAVKKVKNEITAKKIPLLGISAAFSFLIMMLNVPLPGGTTGHAVGATLVAILIGPFSAVIAVSIALLIQALLFGDGGILAFGANCFNMAFVIPFAGYFIYMLIKKIWKSEKANYLGAFIGAYMAINLAAFFAAVEFGIQPLLFKDASGLPLYCPYPLNVSLPAMLIPHLLVAGIIDALVTIGVLAYIKRISPEIVHADSDQKLRFSPLYILLAVLTALTPLGLLASGTAWGEWAAEELKELTSFIPAGMANGFEFKVLLPDYTVPVINNEAIGYVISAIAGVGLLLVAFKIVSAFIQKKKEAAKSNQ
jgi:cobalt/nickel transport system permease protein